jgi:hypothetical protein
MDSQPTLAPAQYQYQVLEPVEAAVIPAKPALEIYEEEIEPTF